MDLPAQFDVVTKSRVWSDSFSSPPDLCSARTGWTGGLVRRWHGTSPVMVQPKLDQHYIVMHLGAKRVRRHFADRITTADVRHGALSIVPARSEWNWSTEGPIGFAHLYLDPHAVERVVREEFDRDPAAIELFNTIGLVSPALTRLFEALLQEVEAPSIASRLILDTLLHAFTVRMLVECSTLPEARRPALHRIAPHRLRRVLDYIDTNLAADLALHDLASVAGTSRFHFSRAFREATGLPPYRYLVGCRVIAAKKLLVDGELSLFQIARRTGFHSTSQLTAMFKRFFDDTPAHFRRTH